MHYHTHWFDDILGKGVSRVFGTKINEKMHGPLRKIYYERTNFKNVADQITRIQHQFMVSVTIRSTLNDLDDYSNRSEEDKLDQGGIVKENFYLGGNQKDIALQDLENHHKTDSSFLRFRIRLGEFLSRYLPAHGIPLPGNKAIKFKASDLNQALREKISQLQLAISVLKAKTSKRKQGRKREAPVDPGVAPFVTQISHLGAKFAVMNEPWINTEIFQCPLPANHVDPFSPERFADQTMYKAGMIAELHSHLGDPCLQNLAATLPSFKTEFQKALNNQRTHTTDRVRSHATIILRELSLPDYISVAKAGEKRVQSDDLTSLWTQGKKDVREEKLAPIFFPDQIINPHTLFLNEFQPRIIRVTLFSPASIKNPDDKVGGNLAGHLWGVRGVNASCIALSAIMLRFIISPDKEFSEVGTVSRIPYREHFQQYRKMIVLAESKGTSWAKSLYDFYNRRVFAGVTGITFALTDPSTSGDGEIDELDALMQQLVVPSAPSVAHQVPHASSDPSSNTLPSVVVTPANTPSSSDIDAVHAGVNDLDVTALDPSNQPRGRRGGTGHRRGRATRAAPSSTHLEAESDEPECSTRPKRSTRRN
ncbi:hypothetical protein D9758_017254 [Tetrapyrgos nigripes]|uniref:Uncharacterized protein n=1 Tax=Tetrapyrgos nigripes TaxID=182062 RepID=A0A8H5FFD3_9AGAR|nr:hypothetical protein D9758_017254 [Tetrapyrgos nigripes]